MKLGNLEDVVYCTSMVGHICVGSDSDVVHVNSNSRTERFVFENDVAVDIVRHRLKCRW